MEQLKKRLLSLLWRTGAGALVVLIAGLVNLLPEFKAVGVPEIVLAVVGLAMGEATKFLNSKYQLGSRLLGRVK